MMTLMVSKGIIIFTIPKRDDSSTVARLIFDEDALLCKARLAPHHQLYSVLLAIPLSTTKDATPSVRYEAS